MINVARSNWLSWNYRKAACSRCQGYAVSPVWPNDNTPCPRKNAPRYIFPNRIPLSFARPTSILPLTSHTHLWRVIFPYCPRPVAYRHTTSYHRHLKPCRDYHYWTYSSEHAWCCLIITSRRSWQRHKPAMHFAPLVGFALSVDSEAFGLAICHP